MYYINFIIFIYRFKFNFLNCILEFKDFAYLETKCVIDFQLLFSLRNQNYVLNCSALCLSFLEQKLDILILFLTYRYIDTVNHVF